jgi:hypothetical protein
VQHQLDEPLRGAAHPLLADPTAAISSQPNRPSVPWSTPASSSINSGRSRSRRQAMSSEQNPKKGTASAPATVIFTVLWATRKTMPRATKTTGRPAWPTCVPWRAGRPSGGAKRCFRSGAQTIGPELSSAEASTLWERSSSPRFTAPSREVPRQRSGSRRAGRPQPALPSCPFCTPRRARRCARVCLVTQPRSIAPPALRGLAHSEGLGGR